MPNYLAFTVADMRFAIPLERSEKVVPLVALKAIPKADACVAGVMNVTGVGVPVIDLAIRLDLPEKRPYSLATSIVICENGGQSYGLIAERIDGVIGVDEDAIELSDLLTADAMPYLGMCRGRDGQQVLMLDLDRILDIECAVLPPPPLEAASA